MPDDASGSGSASRLAALVGTAALMIFMLPSLAHARQGRAQPDPGADASPRSESRAEGLDFMAAQLAYPRVKQARLQARFDIKRMFRERGISYPAGELFIRVFKRERLLELWVRPIDAEEFVLLRQYMVCALRGDLGPKRLQGDRQTPEGFYEIDNFNPTSAFHLALHVNYPNRSDRLAGRSRGTRALGGEIMIHGGCQTEGCIAVTNDAIKEIYWMAVEARAAGQEHIPVHIFPARLTDEDLGLLAERHEDRSWLVAFWTSLKPGFDYFERTRRLPPIRVDDTGHYLLLSGRVRKYGNVSDADASPLPALPPHATYVARGPRLLGVRNSAAMPSASRLASGAPRRPNTSPYLRTRPLSHAETDTEGRGSPNLAGGSDALERWRR